ncbi:MAG: hypothetical protein HWD59_05535 [Coxiellaceae bacterium]|nr:MAG: hypothetical protein HWD59_05535 [Coxiellaceae bacterium]
MWWGNNGRSFQLFENDKLVDSGDLTANSPNAQTHTSTLTNRAPGTYSYKVVVTNSKGSVTATNSYTVTDYGTAPTPPAPPVTTSSISISPGDSTTQQVAQLVVKQGQTASFNLNEDGVKSPQYRLTFSNPGVIKSSQVSAQGVMTLTASDQLGRTALKIEDPNTHAVRYVGIVTVDKNNNRPGLPTYLAVGSVSQDDTATINFWQQFGPGETNKRVDIRYIYLNNGPYNGWSTWGNRVPTFVNNSLKLGMIPFFVYYNINNGSDSLYAIKENMQNKDFMEAYFKDLKLAVTQAKTAANGERVGFVLEADMLGYFQQAEPNKSPKEQPVLTNAAYSSGVLDANDPQFENNITGLVKAINYIIRKYDSTAILGWQLNLWANPQDNGGTGIIHATDSCNQTDATCIAQARQKIINNAKGLMQYGLAAEINYKADFVSIDKYGLDGGQQANAKNSPEKSTWFWNATLWNNYLLFVNTLHQESNLPIVLWQIPVGHINSPTSISPYSNQPFAVLPNTNAKYEDSAGTFS